MQSSGSIARRRPHRPARRTLLNLGVVRVDMRGDVSSSYIDIPIRKPSQMLVMRREFGFVALAAVCALVLCDRDRRVRSVAKASGTAIAILILSLASAAGAQVIFQIAHPTAFVAMAFLYLR